MLAQHLDDAACVASKAVNRLWVLPSAFFDQPKRIGKVVQRDHRLDPPLTQVPEHLAIPCQSCVVELTRAGFNSRPLYRDAHCVQPQFGGAVEIGLGVLPPVACPPGLLSILDVALFLLPCVPIVVYVVSLDLVRGGGDAPFKIGREVERGFGLGRLCGWDDRGGDWRGLGRGFRGDLDLL